VRAAPLADSPDTSTPDVMAAMIAQRLPFIEAKARVTAEFERRFVEQTLADHGGNVARAAAASGIGRRYFNMIRSRSAK
jgi:hypothetical protein